jgi:hypothetical protein
VAAENNLSHEQLKMFMTPKEIRYRYEAQPEEYEDHELSHEEVMYRKLHESKKIKQTGGLPDRQFVKDSLYHSVKKEGVKTPIQLNPKQNTIYDGHHRLAAATHLAPNNLIPVEYE